MSRISLLNRRWVLPWAVGVVLGLPVSGLGQAEGGGEVEGAEEIEGEPLVELNFPPQVELRLLIDYVAERVGLNILYDESVGAKAVTLRVSGGVPVSSLLPILESALRMKGMALVDAEVPGAPGSKGGDWKRVVVANNLLEVSGDLRVGEVAATQAAEEEKHAGPSVVTQVFRLEHEGGGGVRGVEASVRPFLTQSGGAGGSVLAVSDPPLLIVTDFAERVDRIGELIRLLDQPVERLRVAFVPVEHLEAGEAADRVTQIEAARAAPGPGGGVASEPPLNVLAEPRTNQLVLVGTEAQIEAARATVGELDVALGLQTRVYRFAAVSPERVDRLTRELLPPERAGRVYRSTVDREGNLLVVTAPEAVHAQVEQLRASLDVPVGEEQSPVRFYKLLNATAGEVLETIRQIEGAGGGSGVARIASPPANPVDPPGGADSLRGVVRPQLYEPPAEVEVLPPPVPDEAVVTPEEVVGGPGLFGPDEPPRGVRTADATIVADTNTNSLIVVAPPAVQAVYERLIAELDRRRPQVLIETTIVTLDTSNGFSLGVEVSRRDTFSIGGAGGDVLTFSSFGLSDVDPDTGSLSIIPGIGFNGAILSPDIADVVVRALGTTAKAQVVSAPRVLVNDNATGTIAAVAEQPFQSVNASDTVATTSFGGFVQAGTQITVTPQIAEGDHLRLSFAVDLSNFSGGGDGGLPPPRQTNSVVSEVTVPDGHTIIVGGINRRDVSQTESGVPVLRHIPVLGNLFKSQTQNEANSTLFVFIRPTILRDDLFEDLKYISAEDVTGAGLEGDYPQSSPMLMR